jgi:hypothetical protein
MKQYTTHISRGALLCALWGALLVIVDGYQLLPLPLTGKSNPSPTCKRKTFDPVFLAQSMTPNQNNNSDSDPPLEASLWSRARSQVRTFIGGKKRIGISLALIMTSLATGRIIVSPLPAHASAPVMALPKAEGRDPATEAISVHERKMAAEAQRELMEMAKKARQIEAEQGEAARVRFEKEFKEAQAQKAQKKLREIEQIQRDLLDNGMCPFTDLEGQRQVTHAKIGVDLGKVPGTIFYVQKEFENSKSPKIQAKSRMVQKAPHREIIKLMVQDMKNRGIDPLEYFKAHQDQTEAIYDLDKTQAERLVAKYTANLEEYGQITPPKPGELSVKELQQQQQMTATPKKSSPTKEEQAEAKRLKELAKQEAAQRKAAAKLEAQIQKEAAKMEKLKLKEAAAAEKRAANEQFKEQIQQQAAAAVVAALSKAGIDDTNAATLSDEASSTGDTVEQPDGGLEQAENEEDNSIPSAVETKSAKQSMVKIGNLEVSKPIAAATSVVIVGGGGYAISAYRKKSAEDEAIRQQQFQLLMGQMTNTETEDNEVDSDTDTTQGFGEKPSSKSSTPRNGSSSVTSTAAPQPVETPKKQKRLGLKSVFGKKKSDRETDLFNLVSGPDAIAPAFATTLAKLLAFGAPGRFPQVETLPDADVVIPDSFDLEDAKRILADAQAKAGLTLQESAELFANVVNCMIIDIVDLASTSLKEKDDNKSSVQAAMNIVVEFMNHAASLYDSIAKGVTIQPVTYGGDLSKSKLEQLYGLYAAPLLLDIANAPEDLESRLGILQDMFQISDKKAEGIVTKAVNKQMMSALKDGKLPEGMEETMKQFGELGGLGGLGGGLDGANGLQDPSQLKEMLKALLEMKEKGELPADEFQKVRQQFKEAFGESIDDVLREADSKPEDLSAEDRELLDLMKAVMQD